MKLSFFVWQQNHFLNCTFSNWKVMHIHFINTNEYFSMINRLKVTYENVSIRSKKKLLTRPINFLSETCTQIILPFITLWRKVMKNHGMKEKCYFMKLFFLMNFLCIFWWISLERRCGIWKKFTNENFHFKFMIQKINKKFQNVTNSMISIFDIFQNQ